MGFGVPILIYGTLVNEQESKKINWDEAIELLEKECCEDCWGDEGNGGSFLYLWKRDDESGIEFSRTEMESVEQSFENSDKWKRILDNLKLSFRKPKWYCLYFTC